MKFLLLLVLASGATTFSATKTVVGDFPCGGGTCTGTGTCCDSVSPDMPCCPAEGASCCSGGTCCPADHPVCDGIYCTTSDGKSRVLNVQAAAAAKEDDAIRKKIVGDFPCGGGTCTGTGTCCDSVSPDMPCCPAEGASCCSGGTCCPADHPVCDGIYCTTSDGKSRVLNVQAAAAAKEDDAIRKKIVGDFPCGGGTCTGTGTCCDSVSPDMPCCPAEGASCCSGGTCCPADHPVCDGIYCTTSDGKSRVLSVAGLKSA